MALRRGNGTGSVYKMKHKKLRKPFRAVATLGWTEEGKAIRKTIGTYTTQKDAYEALALYNLEPSKFNNNTITVGKCFEWLVEEKTRQGVNLIKYTTARNKLSHLFKMPIKDLKIAHMQQVIDDNSHLKYSSLRDIKHWFSSIYTIAMKNDVVTKNYASFLVLPKEVKSSLHQSYTIDELITMWNHEDDKFVKLILIYVYTGMRPSELMKIKIDDVHLEDKYVVGGIKNESSKNRIIPIANCIMPFVKEIYQLARFSKSKTLVPKNYMSSNLNNRLREMCEKIGIAPHLMHDGRHTFATLCSTYNIPEHITKAILGHSHKDITNSVYVHRTVEQLLNAVNTLPHHDQLTKSCAVVEQRSQNK